MVVALDYSSVRSVRPRRVGHTIVQFLSSFDALLLMNRLCNEETVFFYFLPTSSLYVWPNWEGKLDDNFTNNYVLWYLW